MTWPTSRPWISQRGGRQSKVRIQASSWLSPDHHEDVVSEENLTAPNQNHPLSPRPNNRIAYTTMESQEVNNMVATIKLQDYPNVYKDPDPITPDLTVDAKEAQRRVMTEFGDEM